MTVARCPWQGRVVIKLNSDLKLEVVNDGTNNNCVCIKFDREIDRDSDKLQKGTLPDRYLKAPGFDANAPSRPRRAPARVSMRCATAPMPRSASLAPPGSRPMAAMARPERRRMAASVSMRVSVMRRGVPMSASMPVRT